MEHADALERIEIAAAEPDGLERLMAGDTPDAAAVAGHLAGCPVCVAELARIRRTAELARQVIEAQPDPALRERTLDFVRAVGRDRSSAVPPAGLAAPPSSLPAVPRGVRVAWLTRPAWSIALAAAVIIVGLVGFAAGSVLRDQQDRQPVAGLTLLSNATTSALRIEAQPDARRVTLTSMEAGATAVGSLVFSAASGQLVVVATGLPVEAAGQEYGCWVEVDGTRRRLGRMYRAGDVSAWSGPADGLSGLPPGTTFGVSLGPAGGSPDATPVLTGRL